MSEEYKGKPDLYDVTVSMISDEEGESFFSWLPLSSGLSEGQICGAVVWYDKTDRWYLVEEDYKQLDEANSTWKAVPYSRPVPPPPEHNVMRYFKISKDESLVTIQSKFRPVVLLTRYVSDWWNPINAARHVQYWLCAPVFSYKSLHLQDYVLKDQRLETRERFYMPSVHGRSAGMDQESAARLLTIQAIPEQFLQPWKIPCVDVGGGLRPYRVGNLGLRIILYHYFKGMNLLASLEDEETQYDCFKEYVNDVFRFHERLPSTL